MPDRAEYIRRCEARWHSWALRDARHHWDAWVALHGELMQSIVVPYLRDNWARDLHGKCLNPNGTLSGYCWAMSDAFAESKGQLGHLLDFNESSQTVFLRRGLIIYLALCIEELKKQQQPSEQLAIPGT